MGLAGFVNLFEGDDLTPQDLLCHFQIDARPTNFLHGKDA
jgi:hypothetical protein